MKAYLLDTSAYSFFMRGHENAKARIQEAGLIGLTPVILAELLAGFMKGGNYIINRRTLDRFLESPRVQIFDIDSETSDRYAVILNGLWKIGRPVPTNDIWIAASAMQHGLEILTNDSHYSNISQVIVHILDSENGL